jgi:MFS family permease
MEYIHFFLNNRRLISFGFLLTLFSSFGQTFLISLFVPGMIAEFQMSNSSFGVIYGSATVMSSLTLAHVGKFIDSRNLRSYTSMAVLLLMASCLLISFSLNLVMVFVGFWGLRLAGQGLLTHISSTSVARFFHETRGKALSLSFLGYSLGEGFFPITVGALIGLVGWRSSMLLNAALIGLVLLPFVMIALNKKELQFVPGDIGDKRGKADFSRSRLFLDRSFYIIALSSVVLPFTVTGLFFYQLVLAGEKGWSVEWLTASFIGYAAGRAVSSLLSGKLIDRYSATFLFPFYLIPFVVGLLVLTLFSGPLIAPLYLTLTGISVGLGTTIITALLAETYGTADLGSIRSVFATFMILSTAVGPVLFGFLLDSGLDFTAIAVFSACVALLAISVSFRLQPGRVQLQAE